MELNQRSMKILQLLFENDKEYLPVKQIAHALETSERVVGYNLSKLDTFLTKKGCDYIERVRGKGIRIVKTEQLVKVYNNLLGSVNPYVYRFSSPERENYIASYLLLHNEYTSISLLSKKLGISYSTTVASLPSVEQALAQDNIALVRRPRLGIRIEGEESDIRNSYIRLFQQAVPGREVLNYFYGKPDVTKIAMIILQDLCPSEQADLFTRVLKNVEYELGRHFSDDNFAFLLLYLALSFQRVRQGCYLPTGQISSNLITMNFAVFERISKQLDNQLGVTLPQQEAIVLFHHLLGAQSLNIVANDDANFPESQELHSIADEIVSGMERIYNVTLGESRNKTVQGLLAHLIPAVNRIHYQHKLINPIYNELITNHRQLMINTRIAIAPLEKYLNHVVDNHEVSFIAIYFLAALNETAHSNNPLPRVLVVCGSGYGTAQAVAAQLQNLFNAHIIDVISGRDAPKYKNRKEYDYLVSTVDLPDFSQDEYIKVNPVFTAGDYAKLKNYLDVRYVCRSRAEQIELTKKISAIAEKFGVEKDLQQMRHEILAVIMGEGDNYLPQENSRSPSLRELMFSNLMRFNVECNNWREAVAQGTLLMEENRIVEPRYKDAIVRNLLDFGPNMVMYPNVLISHARPEDGCLKLAFGFVHLKRPTSFGSRYHDPVKVIITLSVLNGDTHLNALIQLFNLLSDSDARDKLLRVTTKDEVFRLIDRYSN